MSIPEARRVTIIAECNKGIRTNEQAAQLLSLSIRQVQRLKAKNTIGGPTAVLHGNRGRRPAHALSEVQRQQIVSLYQTEMSGYNFTHARDVLDEDKDVIISRSTVSRILHEVGIKSPKSKRRKKKHRTRDARSREGSLAQMDASYYDWLSDGSYLHLHGAIDDATGRILALYFEKEETTHGYNELVYEMNRKNQLPREFYVDSRSTFRNNQKPLEKLTIDEELSGSNNFFTQFQRSMNELNILLIYAKSAQAKGRIERLWETLQDRLPKDMMRKDIHTLEDANLYLKTYVTYYNRKFAVKAREPEKEYCPKVNLNTLKIILATQDKRVLDNGLCFAFNGQKYVLPEKLNNKKVPASNKDIIIVATSEYIGIQVLHKGLILSPKLLKERSKESIVEKPIKHKLTARERSEQATLRSQNSSWRKTNSLFFANHKSGDIVTAQLTPTRGDIIKDY